MRVATLIALICCLGLTANAQVQLSRTVIGSTGGFSEAGPVSLSATVGEAVPGTFNAGGIMLTQGFQQPRVAAELELEVAMSSLNATCLNSEDGLAIATVAGGTAPYTYDWSDGIIANDSAQNLNPGTYNVLITDAAGRTGMGFVTVDAELFENCGLTVFNGFSPNADNHNDQWVIEHIEDWPNNMVQIYNRWGDLVWETNSYNNETNFWIGTTQEGADLPDGTYFYLVTYGNEAKKGWVQITR